ncbi:heme ABC transporter ATP-binding protein [Roseovarius sp. EL26]|uniref:heme ABC transporter ATP-binding protein n=1 Tax=Roseovarius sp. EL26 TaxID=2126672 RepID=UPI000EA00D55|nr:heme ABC transporter ATP-binding protein [Roseovarius sp. EL26]
MLKARHIGFSYRHKTVLNALNFTAKPGEITAIVGHNGSGKTTLMKVITGEEQAKGNVTLNGIPVAPDMARQLATVRGVLAQSTQLAFPFKVIEILRIGLLAGPYARRDAVMMQALEAVGLSGFADRFYHQLSGGEQQRVQLARVLCQVWQPLQDGAPCWLFLDEPVTSLDIGHQVGIMEMARNYADNGGGVVTVMHDLNLTYRYADNVALMKNGTILAQDAPSEVFNDHALTEAYSHPLQVLHPAGQSSPYIMPAFL